MGFPSSPPLMQGSGFFKQFATPKTKPKVVYYEDLYGSPNEDEEFDRFPEACESESDGEAEESGQISKSGEHKRFFQGSYAGSSVRGTMIAQPSTPATDEQNTPGSEKRYKIAPNINSSRSTELSPLKSRGMLEVAENQGALGSTYSATLDHHRSKASSGIRMPRPTSRRLFKQELAKQDKKAAESTAARIKDDKRINAIRRKEKTAVRRANVPKKPAKLTYTTNKEAKLTRDLGSDDARSEVRKAHVLVGHTGIDVEEYEYFSN